jgi:hypothetical protein
MGTCIVRDTSGTFSVISHWSCFPFFLSSLCQFVRLKPKLKGTEGEDESKKEGVEGFTG